MTYIKMFTEIVFNSDPSFVVDVRAKQTYFIINM